MKDSRGEAEIWVNEERFDLAAYHDFHQHRIDATLRKLSQIGTRRTVELGAHPWVMTAALVDDPSLEVAATVSAEEVTRWPDAIPITKRRCHLRTSRGGEATFVNYSANVERTLFNLDEEADTVLACEVIEHLVRAPHCMLLNANRWIPEGGKLLLTTPNGAQFSNPLRRRSPTASFRCHTYERHHYLFTLEGLEDLVRLCGFEILESGYWNVYRYGGLSRLLQPLARVPWNYLQAKCQKTIFLVAEKRGNVGELERLPLVYHPSPHWEYICQPDASAPAGLNSVGE